MSRILVYVSCSWQFRGEGICLLIWVEILFLFRPGRAPTRQSDESNKRPGLLISSQTADIVHGFLFFFLPEFKINVKATKTFIAEVYIRR